MWLRRLIDRRGGVYETPNGVVIDTDGDGIYYLSSTYPKAHKTSPKVDIELYREYRNLKEFIEAFAPTGQQDLDRLTPEMILAGYKRGIIDICASLDESLQLLSYTWGLQLRIHNGTTHAIDRDTSQLIVYNRPLLLSDDIINYMQQYAATHRLRLLAYTLGLPANKAIVPN